MAYDDQEGMGLGSELVYDPKLHRAMQKIKLGGTLTPDEIPQWYEYKDGKLERPSMGLGKMALIGAGLVGPSILSGIMGAGAPAAGAGASAMTQGASSVLPSSQIGAGYIPAIGSAAAPAAGGMSGILGTLGRFGRGAADIGEVLTGGAAGSAEGRRQDAMADMYSASANNRALRDVAEFNQDAPAVRAQQVARGDLMAANIPRASFAGSGKDLQMSGGLGPDVFGPATTQAGEEMRRQALAALMNRTDQIQPQLTRPRRAGVGENIMAGTGMGLGILGALGGLFGGR